METIRYRINPFKCPQVIANTSFDRTTMLQTWSFHKTLPGYAPTPLRVLGAFANHLGVAELYVKDESFRFGLNSFKGLGGSYALAKLLAEECGVSLESFSQLKELLKNFPVRTFVTATDGNHGRGLAWAAQQFGQRAVVYMPKGALPDRLNAIRALGANAEEVELNYDDTVRYAMRMAEEKGWTLVQDTAKPGYETIPLWIMQSYLTMIGEILQQLKEEKRAMPTHVILQAGVGSFPGAIAAGLLSLADQPITLIIVEPTRADCFYQSACAHDGLPRNASGDLSTMMAGLSCGEPNPLAWNILKATADCFVTCPDEVAAEGMRILGNPLANDARIVSGESGAVSMGLLFEICRNNSLQALKESLRIDSATRVLMISTEGDTDPQNYRSIMAKTAQ